MQFGCLCHSLLAVWSGQSWDASCLLYYTASVVGSELGHMSALLYSAVRSELGYVMSAILYSQCSRVRVGIRHICHITQQVVPVAGVWMGKLAVRSGWGWDTPRIPPSHAAGGLAATQLCGCSLRTVPLSGHHQ